MSVEKEVFNKAFNESWHVEVDGCLPKIKLLYMRRRGQQQAGIKYCKTTLKTLAYVTRKYPSLFTWMAVV